MECEPNDSFLMYLLFSSFYYTLNIFSFQLNTILLEISLEKLDKDLKFLW